MLFYLYHDRLRLFNRFLLDYDECDPSSTIRVADCGAGGKCINIHGSYRCECDTGFKGTPPDCSGIGGVFIFSWAFSYIRGL